MPDFVPWQLKIGGVTDTSLVSQVSITTLVDSTNQVTFSVVKGSLLSDKKFILIPDGTLEAPPPQGYVALRTDTLQSRWWDEEQKNITASVTLKSGTRAPDTTLDKSKKDKNGALVIQSFRWNDPAEIGLDTETRIAKPLEKIGYAVTRRYKATKTETLSKDIKGKQIWYSIAHGFPKYIQEYSIYETKRRITFVGVQFRDGQVITANDLNGKDLDYRLVMMDVCISALTVYPEILVEDGTGNKIDSSALTGLSIPYHDDKPVALREDELKSECKAFANAFGNNVAYVGWAWTMHPEIAQKMTFELIGFLKGKKTVAEAHTAFRQHHGVDHLSAKEEARLLKIYGTGNGLNNVIDLKTTKGGTP